MHLQNVFGYAFLSLQMVHNISIQQHAKLDLELHVIIVWKPSWFQTFNGLKWAWQWSEQ